MSEHEEAGAWMTKPKQLVGVIVVAFAVPILIAALASQFVTSGRRAPGEADQEKVLKLIAPVARLQLAQPGAAGGAAKTGEQIYQGACTACHAAGVAGAPKLGDKAAWATRIGQGLEALTKAVIAGKGAMPPRGGNADLTDAEVARAVVFIANQSGANFKEPAVAAPPAQDKAAATAKAPERAPAAPEAKPAKPAAEPVAKAAEPAAQAAKAAESVVAAKPEAGAGGQGKSIYAATCIACHGTGVANAPKLGDKTAWINRLSGGVDTLVKTAIAGKGAMPPKGGNAALSDDQVRAAVQFMVSEVSSK